MSTVPLPVNLPQGVSPDLLVEARAALAELNGFVRAMPPGLQGMSAFALGEASAFFDEASLPDLLQEVFRQQVYPARERHGLAERVFCYAEALNRVYADPRTLHQSEGLLELCATLAGVEGGEPVSLSEADLGAWCEAAFSQAPGQDPLVQSVLAASILYLHPNARPQRRALSRVVFAGMFRTHRLLHRPFLFLNGYLGLYREDFDRALKALESGSDWGPLLHFVLRAVRSQGVKSRRILERVVDLYRTTGERLQAEVPRLVGPELHRALFTYPVLGPICLGELTGVHYTTATRHLKELTARGWLEHHREGKYQLYDHRALLELLLS